VPTSGTFSFANVSDLIDFGVMHERRQNAVAQVTGTFSGRHLSASKSRSSRDDDVLELGCHSNLRSALRRVSFCRLGARRLAVRNTLELSRQNCSRSFQILTALDIAFNVREILILLHKPRRTSATKAAVYYCRRGKRTVNTVPASSDRASTSPPWALATSRTIYSPSPRLPSESYLFS
jgi:hypothetical protein